MLSIFSKALSKLKSARLSEEDKARLARAEAKRQERALKAKQLAERISNFTTRGD